MIYKPITKNQLDNLILENFKDMPEDAKSLFLKLKIEPYSMPAYARPDSDVQHIFIVARKGNQVIFYNDIEEDFCIGTLKDNNKVDDWKLYGLLETALRELALTF